MNDAASLGDSVPVSIGAGDVAPLAATIRLVMSKSPELSHWYAMVEGLAADEFPMSAGGDSPVVVTLTFPDGSQTRAFITLPQKQLGGVRFVTGPGQAPRGLGGDVSGVREPRRPRPSSDAKAAAELPGDAT